MMNEPRPTPANSNIDEQITNARQQVIANDKKIEELRTLLKHLKAQEAQIRALKEEVARTQRYIEENAVTNLDSIPPTRSSSLGMLYDDDDLQKMPPPSTT